RDVEIRRDGLRIVVRDDRGDLLLPQREDPLDATVVELDALPDPDRAAPHDQHLPTRQFLRLPAGLVGRVEVRRLGLELASAVVAHLVDYPEPRSTDREPGPAREPG